MLKFLAIVISLALAGCSTIGANRIVEIGKKDLASCCQVDHRQYDLIASQSSDGWLVRASPKRADDPTNQLILRAGGDIQLSYDRHGQLKGVFRGQ